MGREYKFRAWDIRNKKMRGVMDIKWFDNGTVRVNATETDKNYEPLLYKPNYNGKEFKEFELMQYTGLKDKNGTEIYEGDILKRDNQTFKVVWGMSEPSFFALTNEKQGNCYSVHGLASHGATVIGNVWEDGGLLDNKTAKDD